MDKQFYDKYSKDLECSCCQDLQHCINGKEPLKINCAIHFFKDKIADLEAENKRLNYVVDKHKKQALEMATQLAEKEQEIERVKQEKTCYYNFGANCHKVTFKTIDGKEFDVYNDKGYQAIKELEELKNYLPNIALDIPDMVSYMKLLNKIDQQIKKLKGDI